MIFVYTFKVGLCLIVFYLLFKLFLSKETFHHFNRMMLLGVMFLSLAIPFAKVSLSEPSPVNHGMVMIENLLLQGTVVPEESSFHFSVISCLCIVIALGWLFFLLRILFSVVHLIYTIRKKQLYRYQVDDAEILVMSGTQSPFSWYNKIIMSKEDYEEHPDEILVHELAHVRLHHSWDILLANLFIIFQWFNPASWLLKRELQNVHEYEADKAVINRGVDAKQYQLLLIKKSVGEHLFSMANYLNYHSLKNRITMMQMKQSNPWRKMKALVVLPMAALTIVAFANPKVERIAEQVENESGTVINKAMAEVKTEGTAILPQLTRQEDVTTTEQALPNDEKVTVTGVVMSSTDRKPIIGAIVMLKGTKKGTVTDLEGRFRLSDVPVGTDLEFSYVGFSSNTKRVEKGGEMEVLLASEEVSSKGKDHFDVVEVMPTFPGGMGAMMKWLSENIKYPEAAYKAKQQGRVIVTFIVDKDGSIGDVAVAKSVAPSLDEEAVRVVKSMPNWNPGMQNGKPVRVKYTVPVTFKLDGGRVNADAAGNSLLIIETPEGNKVQPLYLVNGKEISAEERNKIDPSSIQSITVLKNEEAVRKYGNKGKDGVVEIILKD